VQVKPWVAVVVIVVVIVIIAGFWMNMTRKPPMPEKPTDIPDIERMQGMTKGMGSKMLQQGGGGQPQGGGATAPSGQ